jgi:glutathione S-transferase
MDDETLRILGRANSFNVRKVLWLCDELGLAHTREDWGRGFRPTTTPEFLRLNPVAQVPVVLDGDLVLRESHAILRYLCLKHAAEHLYPSPPAQRFQVERWMDWISYDLTHAMRGAFLGGQLGEAPWNNPWFVAQGRTDFTHCMRLVEDELTDGRAHACGDAFTLADIPLGLVVNRWFAVGGFEKPELPRVAAYLERLSQRPAYRAHGRNGLP